MDIPIIHETDRFEFIEDISSGEFSVTRLMKDKQVDELVAIKYIERGPDTIDEYLEREIVNHRSLWHPNILKFKEVFLTPSHLGIAMEHAPGGSLSDVISNEGRFNKNKALHFFRQLISGVTYIHSMDLCHGDLKLKNMLLDESEMPRLKICNFGYSESSGMNSNQNSRERTAAPYMAPEVIRGQEYDGKMADVWSCGMALYYMLVGYYPFEIFRRDPIIFDYSFPDDVAMSIGCRDLICSILADDPSERLSLAGIKGHGWLVRNPPNDFEDEKETGQLQLQEHRQSIEEIMQIISDAKTTTPGLYSDESDPDADDDSCGEVINTPP